MITLFETDVHKNVMFHDLSVGKMVQANQHIIIRNNEAIILDPGGHKIHTKLFAQLSSVIQISRIKYIFFSHQDPDIVAAANAWLMLTEANAFLPAIWIRFVAHFGVDELAAKRIHTVGDSGTTFEMGGTVFKILPAHYLHSSGNLNLYDPVSKILYSGDIGASPAANYPVVEDFDDHIRYMEAFHKRYMPSTKALKMWIKMVRTLDIETIAPQHGAIMQGPDCVARFLDWLGTLTVGADALGDAYVVPE